MENKAIQIEPKAATYVSYPTTTMKECPSKAEIRDKFPESTTSSNELADYSSITLNFSERQEFSADSLVENWLYNRTEQRDIQLRYGSTILLSSNGTNMLRTCTVAVTAMGYTTYISFAECQSFIANNFYFNKLN